MYTTNARMPSLTIHYVFFTVFGFIRYQSCFLIILSLGDFDLSFKTKSVSNYANTTILNQSLTALTFCIWFQTTQSGSFGILAGDIDLTCEDNGQCTFLIKSTTR